MSACVYVLPPRREERGARHSAPYGPPAIGHAYITLVSRTRRLPRVPAASSFVCVLAYDRVLCFLWDFFVIFCGTYDMICRYAVILFREYCYCCCTAALLLLLHEHIIVPGSDS